jgi:hypothetical protein
MQWWVELLLVLLMAAGLFAFILLVMFLLRMAGVPL